MRTAPSAGRTLAGIVIAILTVTLTVIMLPFALCFGIIAANEHQYGSVVLILLVQFGVPVLGLFTCVRLLRGRPQLAPAAAGLAGSPTAPPLATPRPQPFTVKPAEFQQFRGALMAFIFVTAALWLINTLFIYRRYQSRNQFGTLLYWALAELPYIVALFRNWKRADRFGIALATCYPVITAASSVISFLPLLAMRLRSPYFGGSQSLLMQSLFMVLLGTGMEVLLIVFAWRAVRHTAESDEIMLYAGVLAGSLVYFFSLHTFGAFLMRL